MRRKLVRIRISSAELEMNTRVQPSTEFLAETAVPLLGSKISLPLALRVSGTSPLKPTNMVLTGAADCKYEGSVHPEHVPDRTLAHPLVFARNSI